MRRLNSPISLNFRRRAYTAATVSTLANAIRSAAFHDDDVVQTLTDSTVALATVDNDGFDYFLAVSLNTGSIAAGSFIRFYGCSLDYTVSGVAD